MANNTTNNPLVIDTASGVAVTAAQFAVIGIRWVAPAAVSGNLVTIQDQLANTKWVSVANQGNYVEGDKFPLDKPLLFNGLLVPTLQAGTVYIYVSSKIPIAL